MLYNESVVFSIFIFYLRIEIYVTYKGIALALFQWAHLNERYNLEICHESFFRLARELEGEKKSQLKLGDEKIIGNRLPCFVTFKPILVPGREDILFLWFHDEMLREALLQIADSRFYFNDQTTFQFLEGLIAIGDIAVASDLYIQIYDSNLFINDDYILSFSKNLGIIATKSFIKLIFLHSLILSVYSNYRGFSEDELEFRLIHIINGFYDEGLGTIEIDYFLSTLVKKGCNATIVVELFNENGEYSFRMIQYLKNRGKNYMTLLNFYKNLGFYSDFAPNIQSGRWLTLQSAELLEQQRLASTIKQDDTINKLRMELAKEISEHNWV